MNNDLKEAVEKSPYVFVYGSLKRGYWNNSVLGDAVFVDTAVSAQPNFELFDGGYPVVRLSNDGNYLGGEIYEVDTTNLQNCDWLEGHPTFYERQLMAFDLENSHDGESVMAWVYIGRDVLTHWDLSNNNLIKPDSLGVSVWGDAEEQSSLAYG